MSACKQFHKQSPHAIAVGWGGFVQVLLFMALLLAGYVYVWRKGALDWGVEKHGA